MATISYGDNSSIVALIDSLAAEQASTFGTDGVELSSTSIVYGVFIDGNGISVIGNDFTFDSSGNPTGGTVSEINYGSLQASPPSPTITGLNLSLPELYQISAAQQGDLLLPQLLSGNDTFDDEGDLSGGQILTGYAGDDTFILPYFTGQMVDGGAGLDTAVIGEGSGGLFDEYSLNITPTRIDLQALPGAQASSAGSLPATATFSSVETLQFIDGSVWTDPATSGGQAYGLIQAVLGRTPDSGTLGYWAGTVQQYGAVVAASGLLAAPEAQDRLGGLDASGFVSALYQGVLGRAPEAAGLAYWTGQIDAGVSRATVTADIATSEEARSDLAPVFAAGMFGDNPGAVDVDRLYLAASGSLPGASQLAAFSGSDPSYSDLVGIANALVLDDSNLSNAAFASMIQINSYGAATAGATAYFASKLAAGAGTRGDVVMAYAFSPGIDARVAPYVTDTGVRHS